MKRIFLIDCPGIVPPTTRDTEADILLKGVVRVENINEPEQYIDAILDRCRALHIKRTYEIAEWKDTSDFLSQLARKGGRLLKGGEPDESAVAKMVINDFIRGKIPWYVGDPAWEAKAEANAE